MIKKINVRCEGDINTIWDFHHQDGTVEHFYAYEGSPQYGVDDSKVHDKDPKLDMFLDALGSMTFQHLEDEWGAVDVEYDYHLHVLKVTQQPAEEENAWLGEE